MIIAYFIPFVKYFIDYIVANIKQMLSIANIYLSYLSVIYLTNIFMYDIIYLYLAKNYVRNISNNKDIFG